MGVDAVAARFCRSDALPLAGLGFLVAARLLGAMTLNLLAIPFASDDLNGNRSRIAPIIRGPH